jgi:hypothetical protein
MDSCLKWCTVVEATVARTPCEPGERMKRGVLLDEGMSEEPEFTINPSCPTWCERSYEEAPVTCAEWEIEFFYCLSEAEWFCTVDGGWGSINFCNDIVEENYCPPP